MDFIANILAKLDDETAKTKLDNLTKKQTVDLEVHLTGDTDVTKILSKLDGSFASAGQEAGKNYSKGVQAGLKSYKFNGNTFYKEYFDKAKKDIDEAKTVQTNFSKLLSELDTKGIDKNALKAVNARKKAESEYQKEITKRQKSFSQLDATIASNKTLSWLKNNSKAAKDYGDILTDLAQKQRLATNSEDLRKYTKQVNAIKAEATVLGKTGRSAFEEIGNSFKRIGQFVGTYGIIQQIPNAISQSVNELKQMDDILTEISKTSDLTTSQLKELGSTSFDSASKYGKKASDYLTGIQEMSRSGYYGEQAKQMANLSVLAQAAGDLDANMANSYLLASNAAYQYQGNVEKLNALLDGQNMINRMVMPCRKLMAS